MEPTAKELIQELKASGLSKWRISKELGVTWQTVNMWSKDVFQPAADKRIILVNLLSEISNNA